MRRINAAVWGGATTTAIGAVFLLQSLGLPYSSEIGPGPGLFPSWLSATLVALGALYLVQGLKAAAKEKARAPEAEAEVGTADKAGTRNVLFILLCMTLYVVLLPVLGFCLVSAMFLFALLFKAYRPLVNLAISAGASVFLYVLFDKLLAVNLPVNFLGF
jgi:putative tricarboxylic transport membrane protein